MEKKSLKQLFESQRDVLAQRLDGMKLPKDAEKAQAVVSNYLNELFDGDGEFRQNLTQSEDYILQAAMSLLNAQQSMIAPLAQTQMQPEPAPIEQEPIVGDPIEEVNTSRANGNVAQSLKREQYPIVLGGSAIGSAAGALIMGSWGAVFGAIAGTALVLYASSQNTKPKTIQPQLQKRTETKPKPTIRKVVQTSIDTNMFLAIVSNICDSVDSLIATFRAQIGRVVNKYENQEKPLLEQEYRFLIEGIQTLVGYERAHAEDEKYLTKLQKRVEDLADTLDNYNLTIENYTDDHKAWFETVESDKVSEPRMVFPAIVRDSRAVLPGKVFIPKDQ